MRSAKSTILLLTEEFPPHVGGISTFLYHLALNAGAGFMVLCPKNQDAQEFDKAQPFPIRRLHLRKRLALLTFLWAAVGLARRRGVQVIFCGQFTILSLVGWLVARVTGKPLVILTHGSDIQHTMSGSALRRRLALFAGKRCDLMLANSSYTRSVLRRLGIKGERIRILHPGVDTERFKPNIDCTAVRQQYGLMGKKVLLTVGRLVRRKNHAAIVELLPQIAAKVPEMCYVIVGVGPEESHLGGLVRDLHLEDRVVFAGSISDDTLEQLYAACDLCVLAGKETEEVRDLQPGGPLFTDSEGFGISFIEANACGKPVVAGRTGGVVDAVVDGETGVLVNPDNEEEIKQAILTLLLDPAKAQEMGRKGRLRAEREFSWTVIAGKFDQELEEILEKRGWKP